MKAATLLVLLMVVFSPVGVLFQTPFAYAACPSNYYHPPGSAYCFPSSDAPANSPVLNYADGTAYKTDGSDDLCTSFTSCLLLPVYGITVGFGSIVASATSYIFNVAIKLSLTSTAYGLGFITDGWKAARDLANMFFILILIYIAVTIMLKAESGQVIQMLVWVIFIALIINFSFFITRVVIDTGNVIALQFYNASLPYDATTKSLITVPLTKNVPDLTASIMNALGVHTLLGTDSFANFSKETDGLTQFITLLVLYVLSGAMYFILAAAFLAAGIKFLIRIAVLWLTIIASPLAFIAKAVNGFEEQYDRWQETLISHAFYPAVFLFVFWLITLMANDLSISSTLTSFTSEVQSSADQGTVLSRLVSLVASISIRLGFVMVMIFMAMQAADKLGVMGAKWANNVGGKLSFGTGARVFRNSAGRVGYGISQSRGLQRFAAEGSIAGRLLGRTLLSGSNKLSSATFDYRAPLGPLSKATGADVGKPTKFGKSGFGFKGSVKEAAAQKAARSEQYSNAVTDKEKEAAAEEGSRRAEFDFYTTHPGEREAVVQELETIKEEIKQQTEAQKAANERVEESSKAVRAAVQKIHDLDMQGKRGTPEMEAALAERTRAEEHNTEETRNLGAVTKKLEAAQNKQTKALETQESIKKVLEENTKKLTPEVNIRNIYANSLSPKGAQGSNFTWVANRMAADKIRKGKTSTDHLKEAFEEALEHSKHEGEHGGGEHPTPKPSKPKAAPSGDGGGGHGGDHH